jgi:hypothetical protein
VLPREKGEFAGSLPRGMTARGQASDCRLSQPLTTAELQADHKQKEVAKRSL